MDPITHVRQLKVGDVLHYSHLHKPVEAIFRVVKIEYSLAPHVTFEFYRTSSPGRSTTRVVADKNLFDASWHRFIPAPQEDWLLCILEDQWLIVEEK